MRISAPDAERPALALFAWSHAIDEPSEFLRADRDDIACLVRETHTRRAAIGHGREHRPEQKDKPIRIGVVRADRLRGEVARIAADLGHRRAAFKTEAVLALDHE